jgi:hypothetical protein
MSQQAAEDAPVRVSVGDALQQRLDRWGIRGWRDPQTHASSYTA